MLGRELGELTGEGVVVLSRVVGAPPPGPVDEPLADSRRTLMVAIPEKLSAEGQPRHSIRLTGSLVVALVTQVNP
jgi:hypothetical protein